MNVATGIQAAKYEALLVEGEKSLGLETILREQGCSIKRATSRAAAEEALDDTDLVVVSGGIGEQDVLDLCSRAASAAQVLVVTRDAQLAVKATKLGAGTILEAPPEIIAAQIHQTLSMIDLKRKVARTSSPPLSVTTPPSGVVQRRSAPLPKETTPDAIQALIEAAEALVPMHRFQRVYVDYALRRFGGNKVHTAAALGIDRRTIQRWARARAEQHERPQQVPTTTAS